MEYIEREAARNIFTPPLRDPESLDFWEWLQSEIDAIRSMTDEELADEILRWFNWLNAVEWDDKRIIDWLKREVSTDG